MATVETHVASDGKVKYFPEAAEGFEGRVPPRVAVGIATDPATGRVFPAVFAMLLVQESAFEPRFKDQSEAMDRAAEIATDLISRGFQVEYI